MISLTGRVQEARGFSNELEFTNYVKQFYGLKSESRLRILENQNARFREAQRLGVKAEYSCLADFIPIFGMKWLLDLHTILDLEPTSFENRRRIALATKSKTASDYRAAGVLD